MQLKIYLFIDKGCNEKMTIGYTYTFNLSKTVDKGVKTRRGSPVDNRPSTYKTNCLKQLCLTVWELWCFDSLEEKDYSLIDFINQWMKKLCVEQPWLHQASKYFFFWPALTLRFNF